MKPPTLINGFKVVEYGFFQRPALPLGYVPPLDGTPPLRAVQNLAIGTADGVDGYYLLFCAADWGYVTYEFNETLELAKRAPLKEFGQYVQEWLKCAEPV
jgi:hypothetical protein